MRRTALSYSMIETCWVSWMVRRIQNSLRPNMPFGSIGDKEFGTYFIGYTKNLGRIERMLRNMFIGNPDHDRILDFSTAHTGGLFFVPTEEFLGSL